MRNLKNIHHSRLDLFGENAVTATAWDASSDSLIIAQGPSATSEVIELRRSKTYGTTSDASVLVASWDAPCPLLDLEHDRIIHLHHFAHTETSCLILEGGDIVIVRSNPQVNEEKIEIVGTVDGGITAAAWSPDEEILAVATRQGTLLYMTAEYDGIASATFSPEDARLSKQVSVGWGKAETQFKGKRAKAMRDPTMPEQVDEGSLSLLDDGKVSLSWRGDGAYVAVNTIEDGKRRMIRVFSREGNLESVTEPVNGLESALSWRPQGNLIAGVQRHPQGQGLMVVFFERNGLRHGEFSLRLTPQEASTWGKNVTLDWNIDSSTLAVSYLDRVQLWTMGNYHYYLKQEIRITEPSAETSALILHWHPEEALRLTINSRHLYEPSDLESLESIDKPLAGSIHTLRYGLDVASGPLIPPHDIGTVAVIDGRTLKLTPLRVANVPPPMALHEVELTDNAVDVAINSDNSRIAVLHEASVSIYECKDKASMSSEPFLKTHFALPTCTSQMAKQICVNGLEDVFVLLSDLTTGMHVIYHAPSSMSFPVESHDAIRLFQSVDYKSLCVASDKVVSEIDFGVSDDVDLLPDMSPICTYPALSPYIQVFRHQDQSIAFGLTYTGSIFANEKLLLKNCTSFLVTQSHLIVTTANHLMKFIHITDIDHLDLPPDEPETDERCRSIERGAKLVAVMPTTYAVVLQMPRGNLETVFPRALVLAGIRKSINDLDYKSAFLACRVQRVDMNILHDHDPKLFRANVEHIIKQLGKTEYIDLFLGQLSEDNVSESMYKETFPKSATEDGEAATKAEIASPNNLSGPAKVNTICDLFLDALAKRDTPSSMQNKITASLCKSPPDIESGLRIIASIPEHDADRVEAAVEHICFLTDVNQIYDRALGIYDLRIALLVAQQSQRDPREYLPYLQKLQALPELRRKFTIDDDLKHYSKALGHIHATNDVEAVLTYTEKHSLYIQALTLYRYSDTDRDSILRHYAGHLISTNRYKEAAIAYESLLDYQAAVDAYRSATLWRESLSCATLIPLPAAEITTLASDLLEGLLESKSYSDAAEIARDYLADIPTASKYFCKAYAFASAIGLIARSANAAELLTNTIDPGLAEGTATLTELLADCKSQLAAQVPRLRELRVKKREDPLAFYEGAAPEDIPDNISLAPSATSTTGNTFMTRYTGAPTGTGTIATGTSRRTSKNRRREERKRARGKKGSIYEEEYLVSSIGRLVERVGNVEEDVRRTVDGCLRRGMRERAAALERAIVDIKEACKSVIGEVYEVEEAKGKPMDEEGGERPVGADGVLWDSIEDTKKRVPPVVKDYSRSKLLA